MTAPFSSRSRLSGISSSPIPVNAGYASPARRISENSASPLSCANGAEQATVAQQHPLVDVDLGTADADGRTAPLVRRRARATITRRLCTIAGFCKYAVEEELLDHSPAAHVRRPRPDYESHTTALDRNQLGALLVAAGLGPPLEHALISLLALNGLRSPKLSAPTSSTWAWNAGTGP